MCARTVSAGKKAWGRGRDRATCQEGGQAGQLTAIWEGLGLYKLKRARLPAGRIGRECQCWREGSATYNSLCVA
jgi:hypothetical protein